MSNSQEQSLNENVVFLPVDESSPQFLHSEREREAVERLLNSGPEAFYGSIGPELSSYFLSPQEVSRISSWAQNYHFHEPLVGEQNGADTSVDSEKICSTYDPYQWDVPVPSLELGWPEKPARVLKSSVTVHSSHPAEDELQIREVIRRHLQAAKTVIAVVTDQLTDNAIIFDLHMAASRGVPVYIILNQRTLQQNFTLNRLRHPYMQVRVLRGKTFCSRTGTMVVGEMKENFILVDLESVIHGNYSLTWTDAHLHRQLVTVLRGPVIDSFDKEFRILFADSAPVPDTWGVAAGPQVYNHYQTKDFSHLRLGQQLSAESEITNPPSPPADVFLDWEAMGVLERDSSRPASLLGLHKENIVEKMSQLEIDKDSPTEDIFTRNEHLVWNRRRKNENTSPLTTKVTDNSKTINSNAEILSANSPAAERIQRPEHLVERSISRELSAEKRPNKPERTVTRIDVPPETTNRFYSKRRSVALMESFEEEDNKIYDVSLRKHSLSSTEKKPLILKVPHQGNFSSVSDIMKRLKEGTLRRKEMSSTMSDRTQSMMDLSQNNDSDREAPVPRFLTNLNSDQMTPALALMQRRNDGVKTALNRPPANFTPTERPRSSTLNSTFSSGFYLKKLKSEKEEPAL